MEGEGVVEELPPPVQPAGWGEKLLSGIGGGGKGSMPWD